MTIRQKIVSILEASPTGFRQLAKMLKINERELAAHLSHVSLSIKPQNKRLIRHPFRCLGCGFLFRDRKHFSKPSRCPICKDTQIEDPYYEIE
ncbi:MAG: transcriptional regulator [Thermodesulfobacteriota bacterium]